MKTKKTKPVLLQVAQLGHNVIRKKAHSIDDVQSEKLQSLIDNMIATCKEAEGVGIAAPQVYESLRLFIIASYPNLRYPKAPKMKPLAVINPRIIATSKNKTKDWEGCLSIPGIRGPVPRYTTITVEYTTRDGIVVKKTFKDFVARIFQHEYDHIEGNVCLDRIESIKELITEKEYQKLMKLKYKK